jgi:hypothetical protein
MSACYIHYSAPEPSILPNSQLLPILKIQKHPHLTDLQDKINEKSAPKKTGTACADDNADAQTSNTIFKTKT